MVMLASRQTGNALKIIISLGMPCLIGRLMGISYHPFFIAA